MRVTIEHKEKSTGLIWSKKDYFVDCQVEFSEEEKAIVKARGLRDRGFSIRTSTPLPTKSAYWGSGIMQSVGRLLMLVGLIAGFAGTDYGFLFFIGLLLEVVGWLKTRQQENRMMEGEQQITFRDLLSKHRFTVHAIDPSHAKVLEDEIRSNLTSLKRLLQDSVEIKSKQTFEL